MGVNHEVIILGSEAYLAVENYRSRQIDGPDFMEVDMNPIVPPHGQGWCSEVYATVFWYFGEEHILALRDAAKGTFATILFREDGMDKFVPIHEFAENYLHRCRKRETRSAEL